MELRPTFVKDGVNFSAEHSVKTLTVRLLSYLKRHDCPFLWLPTLSVLVSPFQTISLYFSSEFLQELVLIIPSVHVR